MSNIAGIYYNDTAAAPGWSVSVYFSGCNFHCENCQNPEAQDFNFGQPLTAEQMDEIISRLHENGVARSLSLLGGEPLNPHNECAAAALVEKAKRAHPETKIFIWTGYTLQQLLERAVEEEKTYTGSGVPPLAKILKTANYIIDGRYEEAQRNITLPLRGSANQRIYARNERSKHYDYQDITTAVDKGIWIF